MNRTLQDLVNYHGDRLFDGAIDLDWYLRNPDKATEVAKAYVFHGKQYHDINIHDRVVLAGKQLIDSITMVEEVLTSLAKATDPMKLAIAGYGAGKSHFALMLANLLGSHNQSTKSIILENIRQIDSDGASRIKSILEEDSRPVLIIPINGMRNCNLQQEFFTIIKNILERDGQSLDCLNKFDARFENLKFKVLDHRNQQKMLNILNVSGVDCVESFIDKMNSFDRVCYQRVKEELERQGEKVFEPQAEGELKDLISSVAESHCGATNYYRSMLILFDEFGKYMAFAASAEQRAGSGIMQHLYEGIQAVNSSFDKSGNKKTCTFIGFSQLDLNEYQQTTSMDQNTLNNMKRYVSRFDATKKYYLSVSFESLVANLIEVKDTHPIDLNNQEQLKQLSFSHAVIGDFFQSSKQYPIWSDFKRYVQTVALGCWPLSPLATWTLSYISSINTILQQRSALNILGNAFKEHQLVDLSSKELFHIYATDIYDAGLGVEFCASEVSSTGNSQPAIKYEGVLEKYGTQFSEDTKRILKAIVLCFKLGSYSKSREGAIAIIGALSGVDKQLIDGILINLEDNFNVIEYDSRIKLFEIKEGAPSIHEFERVLNKKILELRKDGTEYSQIRYVQTVILSQLVNHPDIFPDIETSFSSNQKIRSSEWAFKASIKTSIDFERDLSEDDFIRHGGIEPGFFDFRGRIFYFIVPSTHDVSSVKNRILKWIESYHQEQGWQVPIMCLVVHDTDGIIFETSEKITTLDSLSSSERNSFGSMVDKHKDKLIKILVEELSKQKTSQHYVSISTSGSTLKNIGSELFERAYPQVIPFPVDGFTSSSGNGPNTIKKIISALVSGDNNWKSIVDSCNLVDMNRAIALLQTAWGVVDSAGMFLSEPKCIELAGLYKSFDSEYENNKILNFASMMDIAIRPPYGANASSASLIIFIYYASYSLKRGIQIDGTQKRLADFIAQNGKNLFDSKTKGLKYDIARKIEMFPIIRDDERWSNLMSQWMRSNTADELIRYQEEAEKLIEQKVKIPDDFYSQYLNNVIRSANAKQFLKDWDEDCKGLLKDLKVFTAEHQSVAKVIHSLNKFQTASKNFFRKHENLLSEKYRDSIDDVVAQAKNHIAFNLVGWIEAHPFPEDYDKELFKRRVDGYTSLMDALASIGMNEQKGILQQILQQGEEKNNHIISYYLTLKNAKKILDEITSRFENIESATVQNLEQSIREMKNEQNVLTTFDNEHRDFITLNMSNVNELFEEKIKLLESQLLSRKNDFNSLFNISISNIDELENVERKVRNLVAFYVHDKNEDALHDMLKEIKLLRESYNKLDEYNISEDQIKEVLDCQKSYIYEQLEGDTCFDDNLILDTFFSEIEQKRLTQSQKWLECLEKEAEMIKDVESANQVMSRINSMPLYLTKEQRTQVFEIKEGIVKFFDNQKIEYILSMYRALKEEQKQILLKQLVAERKAELGKT